MDILKAIATSCPLSFSNSKGAKVVSVLIIYVFSEDFFSAEVDSATVVSASVVSAAVVSAAVVSFASVAASVAAAVVALVPEPQPARANAVIAASDNAMNFFIILILL